MRHTLTLLLANLALAYADLILLAEVLRRAVA